jgi:hypothetical protein
VDRDGTLAAKTVEVRLGAEPAERRAAFRWPPRLVYAGSAFHIQDPYLLGELASRSPFDLHCYGAHDPNRRFLAARLDYRGYHPTVDFLADYQLGVISVSRDRLRQHSPSTKFPYYFASGLPVLFPEWMKEGHEYPEAAVPFSEETFAGEVERFRDRDRWERMSAAARARGCQLSWSAVLAPLVDLVGR